MDVSARGLAELVGHEAIVTRRYKDSVGVWTVGVGHTKAAGGPDPATIRTDQPVADLIALFRKDIVRYAADVSRALKVPVTQFEFDALVSFHFNTGAIGRASLVKSLNGGASRASVAAGFMAWSKPPEIVGRRTKEMNLFRTGLYASEPLASVYPASDSGAVLWSKGKRVAVLPLLGTTAEQEPVMPPGKTIIRLGSKGPLVAEWQDILIKADHNLGPSGADGQFGSRTEGATRAWQKARGLVDNGVVGAPSWAASSAVPVAKAV